MPTDQCSICGETVLPGWDHCPACQHSYPEDDDEPDDDEWDEDDDDDPDE